VAAVSAHQLALGTLAEPQAGLWPFLVALVVIASAAVLVVVDDPEDYEAWTGGSGRVLAGAVALLLFVGIFQTLGFIVPAALFLFVWLRFLAKESWRVSAVVAAGGALSVFVVFQTVLGVRFPADPIAALLGMVGG
jgi:putative tricarboxylic transport membrane protein